MDNKEFDEIMPGRLWREADNKEELPECDF